MFDSHTCVESDNGGFFMKRKPVNNTDIGRYAIERFARCIFDDVRADYAKPEVQAEFAKWLAEQQTKKQRC